MKALFSALLVILLFCSVTVHAQIARPEHRCSDVTGHGAARAAVKNQHVDCGNNEWALMSGSTGSQAVNLLGTYGTLGVAAPGNTPGGRQSAATWVDASGDLWLFGGFGSYASGLFGSMDDMWKFSAGEWTWMGGSALGDQNGIYGTLGVASPGNMPGARSGAFSWTDASGNLWLFGGSGFASIGYGDELNDLWKYSGGQWTWMGGSEVIDQPGVYGTLGVASASNVPGSRQWAAGWLDSAGEVWLFGGDGYDGSGVLGSLNDLWKYSGGQWTWMGGSNVVNQAGVYGTKGVAASSNIPGARDSSYNWIDPSGNLWLLGGDAYDSTGTWTGLNDLWTYSGGQWTWVSGFDVGGVLDYQGVYGTKGVASANNLPGAREGGVGWSDAFGNGLIFGGAGLGFLNDVWKYSGGEWTWIGGSDTANPSSTVVTQGTFAPGNVPGGRLSPSTWKDAKGNVWIFGGLQFEPTFGNLNDLWWHKP